jgi:hypothetical protein
MSPFFEIPLDLPHAGTIAFRIAHRLAVHGPDFPPESAALLQAVNDLTAILQPYKACGENPPGAEGQRVVQDARRLGRLIVDEIERLNWGEDRLGQRIRNLFECLEHGEEGAAISLRAGENPHSLQRPV